MLTYGWRSRGARRWRRLAAGVALAVAAGVLTAAGPAPLPGQEPAPGAEHRDMMRRMMRGTVPPPGLTPQALPAPHTDAARLFARVCTQCHDLPTPRYKTAAQWPAVLERMLGHMERMGGGMMGSGMTGGGRIQAPSLVELNVLLAYAQQHGMRAAPPEELAAGGAGRSVYAIVCTRCHVPPAPTLHAPGEWPAVVARMEGNMALMNRPPLSEAERETIVAFLRRAAGSR